MPLPYVLGMNFNTREGWGRRGDSYWAEWLVKEENNARKVAEYRQIYQQVPHEVVISKSLLGIDGCADGVEDASCANQCQKWGRGVVPKEREEDDNHPAHNQIDGEANRRYRAFSQRLVEDAKQDHNPLNNND